MALSGAVVRTGWREFWERVKEFGNHMISHYAEEYFKKWVRGEADPPPRHAVPFWNLSKDDADTLFAARPHLFFRLPDGSTRPGFSLLLKRFDVDHIPIPDGFRHVSRQVFADRAPRLGPVLGCGRAPLLPPPPPRPEPVPSPSPSPTLPAATESESDTDYVKWIKCAGLVVIAVGMLGLGVYLHRRQARLRAEAEAAAEEERRRRGE